MIVTSVFDPVEHIERNSDTWGSCGSNIEPYAGPVLEIRRPVRFGEKFEHGATHFQSIFDIQY